MPDRPVPVEAHRDRILALVAPLPAVARPVPDAVGLVTAADVVATADLPAFDHAAMDGYAVRAADVADPPVTLPVAGAVAAGDVAAEVAAGTVVRIMTGAPVPPGADAVVPFEWTDRGGERVRVERAPLPGQHVRRAGEDLLAGRVAVPSSTRLAPRHLALLAAVAVEAVAVHPAPRVAVVATGEELTTGQVPDSNSVALMAAAAGAGAAVQSFGPVPDDPAALMARLAAAAEVSDLVVTTGGVSAGDHDVVKAALGGRDDFWFGSVAVKPGRPQGVGVLVASDGRRVPVVCLPGTPVAAYSTFLLFVEPALRALGGRPGAASVRAQLSAPVDVSPDRTLLLPARYVAPGRVSQVSGHVGHSQRLLAEADVLLVVPPGREAVPAGAEVDVLPLGATGPA